MAVSTYQSFLYVLSPPPFSPLAAYLHLPSSCDILVSPKTSAANEQLPCPYQQWNLIPKVQTGTAAPTLLPQGCQSLTT